MNGRLGVATMLLGGFLMSSFALKPAAAQVVQLPTFRTFGVSTTVWVPDSGGAYLGGTSSAMSGFDTRGVPVLGKTPLFDRLFRNRAIGSSVNSAGASAHVAILDMTEMDQAVLAEAQARRGLESPLESPKGQLITSHAAYLRRSRGTRGDDSSHASTRPGIEGMSIAAIRREQALEDESHNTDAARLIELGRQATESGKPGAARIFYQQAAKKGTGKVREEAQERLAELARNRISRAVADSKP